MGLSTKDFLQAVWPSQGPYCLATPFVTKEGKEKFAHRAYDTIDEVVQGAQGLCFSDRKHVFFCVNTLVEARRTDPNTNKPRTFRTHDNMKECKAFFFDLDVGESEPKKPPKYATAQDAWNGLDQFLFRTGLPEPYVVTSGGGLHVYWALETPLPSLEWRAEADKLRHIAQLKGLKFDPMRTTDQSSVLRVPGTVNYKAHVQKPVRVMRVGVVSPNDVLIDKIDDLAGRDYMPSRPVIYDKAAAADGNLGAGFSGRLTPAEEVFDVCEHVRGFKEAEGKVSEPYWYVMLGLLMWLAYGEDLAHTISSGDPAYDKTETQEKMGQWRDKGPPSCSKIANDIGGQAICEACPFKGRGKNPIDIANKVWAEKMKPEPVVALKEATVADQQRSLINVSLPFVRANGGVGIMKIDPTNPTNNRTQIILAYDLFPIEQFFGTAQEPGYSRWVVEMPLEGQRAFSFETNAFVSIQSFAQALLNVGIFVPDGNDLLTVKRYMQHYLRDLQRHTQSQVMYDHLGWIYPEGNDTFPLRFVMGDVVLDVGKESSAPCALTTNTEFVKELIAKAGTLQAQVANLSFYDHTFYLAHQFFLMCSLGAPLFRILGEHGVLVAMVGETSSSKSTALYTASSFWGKPKKYAINGTPEGSTPKARDDTIMALANYPVCIDEITLMVPDEARSMVMGLTQPNGRSGLTQNRMHRKHRGGLKSTMTLASGNGSVHQLINTNNVAGQAGTLRVMEIAVLKEGLPHTKPQANSFAHTMERNYGHIGPEFMRLLVPLLDKVDARVLSEQTRIDDRFGLKSEERFYSAAAAAALTAGRFAKKLGLMPYDVDAVEDWFGNVLLPALRNRVSSEMRRGAPVEVLGNFIDNVNGETLRIEVDPQNNLGILHLPSGAISARLDVTAQEMWIRTDRFGEYCQKHGHNRQKVTDSLTQLGVIKGLDRRTLTRGLERQERVRTWCYIVDLTHKQVRDVT